MKRLLIHTGPVRSGKSSRLLSFVEGRNDIGGILSLLIDDKKYLYDISSGEKKLLEVDSVDQETAIIEVGKYKFKTEIFEWGKDVLRKATDKNYNYIIIDEIGPLELEGKGLSPFADELISNRNSYFSNILIVIRESLLNKFLDYYELKPEETEFIRFD